MTVLVILLSTTLVVGAPLVPRPALAQKASPTPSGTKYSPKALNPVQTLRAFFGAVITQDAKALRGLILPVSDTDFAFLLSDNAASPEKAKELADHFAKTPMTLRRPGETFAYPNGTKITVPTSPKGVTDAYVQTEEFAQLIRLVRVNDKWRVDTKPFFEGRTNTKKDNGSSSGN